MEQKLLDKFEKLEILERETMNVVKHVHLFFYTYIKDELNFLLIKNKKNNFYSEVHTELVPADNVPPYAVSRTLLHDFNNLFNVKNLNKFKNGEKLTHNDYFSKPFEHYYQYWLETDYSLWLDKLSEEPIVQYDSINGTIIYFIEFPEIDIDIYNLNLTEIECPLELIYINYETAKTNKFVDDKYPLTSKTIMLLNHFNMTQFLKESLDNIKNDNLDYYIVIAIKPKEQSKTDQSGFFHFPALFQGLYRKNNEKWLYNIVSITEKDILKRCKCVIIPGSHVSTYNNLDFVKEAEAFVKDLYFNEAYKHIKILGLCFGEQLVMQALGSKVRKMDSEFIRLPETLNVSKDFWNLDFVKKSKVEAVDNLVIMQAHGDEVVDIPENTNIKNYATSNSCKNEILVSEDERLFLIQGHPEYYPDFSLARAAPMWCQRQGKELSHENITSMMNDLMKNYEDNNVELTSTQLRRLCFAFLKH